MINIAIDGHAGSGKSTVAERLSHLLGLKLLNTGEIYRSFACVYIDENLGMPTSEKLKSFLTDKNVQIKFNDKKQYVYINDKCYKERLRDENVSMVTSQIAAFKVLRDKLIILQRDFADNNDCIIEGRDIGTEVLPNAKVKLFLTASQKVRAKRRFDQVAIKDKNADYNQILEDLKKRDFDDENREVSPLKCAKDAIVIDNTYINLEETVQKCMDIITNKLKIS